MSQAAAHANDSMKRIDQFKKLLEVQESIGGGIDLVSPTREVLKEGRMVKISARTGDHQDRYLFLLSDLLLLCSPRKSMMAGNQFGLRARWAELHCCRMLANVDLSPPAGSAWTRCRCLRATTW